MKRLLSILVAIAMLFSLTACGGPNESDEELLAIVEALCEESILVNRLIFGDGILTKENGKKIGTYTEADAASLADFGVDDVEDVEDITASVYSLAVCAWIKKTVLSSEKSEADGVVLTYARYYVGEVENEDGEKEEIFLVHTSYTKTVGDASYGNYRISEKKKNVVTFLLDITVTHKGQSKVYTDQKVTIYKEAHGWRLDTPTYATYGDAS